jgi:hypothetical protein
MRLTMPIAVFLGLSVAGVSTATAVFLALRANHADTELRFASLPKPEAASVHVSSATGPVVATGTATPNAPDAFHETELALAAQHDAIVASCFTPLARVSPDVRPVSFHVKVGFDADGKQSTKYELVARTLSRPEIVQCIAREILPMQISKGLGPVTVDVILSLP